MSEEAFQGGPPFPQVDEADLPTSFRFASGGNLDIRPRAIDCRFADFIARLAGVSPGFNNPLWQGGFLASLMAFEGRVRLDLERFAGGAFCLASGAKVPVADLDKWRRSLVDSGIVGSPDCGGAPLVLDGDSLYLYRFWLAEREIAQFVIERLLGEAVLPEAVDLAEIAAFLGQLFPPLAEGEVDWQSIAALAVLVRMFVVISGGPGSGKTYTVARIIALIRRVYGNSLRVALAAPTGNAVSRLRESLGAGAGGLAIDGVEVKTLHRLLGMRPGGGSRYGREHLLPYDLIVVDEASMVDLVLMHRLVEAIPPGCRLILLGDHRQLSAVEPGAVFAAFCRQSLIEGFSEGMAKLLAGAGIDVAGCPIRSDHAGDGVVFLSQGHRFGSSGGIGSLARAVAEGDGRRAREIILSGDEEIEFLGPGTDFDAVLGAFFKSRPGFFKPVDLAEAFAWLDRLRVLCPASKGARGVESVNRLVLSLLSETSKPSPVPGEPVMIRRNDYQRNLFNGDIGMAFPEEGRMRVFFPEEGGGMRSFSPSSLSEWETVYAMTVHKSQGSEFDEVLLVLPGKSAPLLSRELFYTAITRARKKVYILGDPALVQEMVTDSAAAEPALAARLDFQAT